MVAFIQLNAQHWTFTCTDCEFFILWHRRVLRSMILDMLCLDPFPRHTCLRGSCPLKPRRHSVRVQARRRVTLPIVQALQTRPKRSTSPRTSVNKGIPIELKIDKPQNVMDTLEQPDATAEQAVLLSKPSSAWQTLLKSLSSRVKHYCRRVQSYEVCFGLMVGASTSQGIDVGEFDDIDHVHEFRYR